MNSTGGVIHMMERRMVTSFMDTLILSLLNHDGAEIGGYDLIKYLHNKFQLLISSGTVYSTLHSMERKGWLKGYQYGGKRVYTLTQKGEDRAKTIVDAEDRILNFISRLLNSKSR